VVVVVVVVILTDGSEFGSSAASGVTGNGLLNVDVLDRVRTISDSSLEVLVWEAGLRMEDENGYGDGGGGGGAMAVSGILRASQRRRRTTHTSPPARHRLPLHSRGCCWELLRPIILGSVPRQRRIIKFALIIFLESTSITIRS
jgi:hypothetical protein